MERFAFRVALKENLFKICRLCGIDYPEKYTILQQNTGDEEPQLWQKIQDCIGFTIMKNDKMPQSICCLCYDKINDFYEFREMCFSTNSQTRKLLGIESEEPQKTTTIDIKLNVDIKEERQPAKRGRKRKTVEIPASDIRRGATASIQSSTNTPVQKKLRLGQAPAAVQKKQKFLDAKPKIEIKDEPIEPALPSFTSGANIYTTGVKLRKLCPICNLRFNSKATLDRHLNIHVPDIPRYVCIGCNETLKKGIDIKNHQLWHKLSKSPFICGLCGEKLLSLYAYTRHIREHSYEVPASMMVLDRECPQCHETFITNFLYNTHPCAIRTKLCAGCNRQLRNEIEYLQHAAMCSKIYLNYSKHIPAGVVASESNVRIKNENDVEAAIATDIISQGTSAPTALVNSQAEGTKPSTMNEAKTTKKGGKKGVSKKDLKRVDDLLKSTIDALVSIKHEPEVHVDTDGRDAINCNVRDDSSVSDNFHYNNNNSDSTEYDDSNYGSEQQCNPSISIKQEVIDESYKDQNIELNIKKEVLDPQEGDALAAGKIPPLKIKITKEHGTLNSSIIDESQGNEKRKKKKKHKDGDRIKDKMLCKNLEHSTDAGVSTETSSSVLSTFTSAMSFGNVHIKEERLDDDDDDNNDDNRSKQYMLNMRKKHITEAPVMTSIPFTQFQISCASSGLNVGDEIENYMDSSSLGQNNLQGTQEEMEDIKPNRAELDRMIRISNVYSGIDLPGEVPERSDTLKDSISAATKVLNQKPISINRKACKSTGGMNHFGKNSTDVMPQIVSVRSGLDVLPLHSSQNKEFDLDNVVIKLEPSDRGYGDEPLELAVNCNQGPEVDGYLVTEYALQPSMESVDFSSIKIKQEPDVDVSDVQLSDTLTYSVNEVVDSNISRRENVSGNGSESDVSSESDEDAQPEDEEEREYREMDLPPLLAEYEDINENRNDADDCRQRTIEETLPITTETNAAVDQQKDGISKQKQDVVIAKVSSAASELSLKESSDVSNEKQTSKISLISDSNAKKSTHLNSSGLLRLNTSTKNNAKLEENDLSSRSVNDSSAQEMEDSVGQPETISGEIINHDTANSLKATPNHKLDSGAITEANGSGSATQETLTSMATTLEEQQNLLNHEVAEHSHTEHANCIIEEEAPLSAASEIENIANETDGNTVNDSVTFPAVATEKFGNEETENSINECADAALRQQHNQQQQQHELHMNINGSSSSRGNALPLNHLLLDDSNINEIAENNNNANIERELQDDNVGP